MNIYVVPGWYPKNNDDLNASFIREQVHALNKNGNRIIVISIKIFSIRELLKYIRYKNRIWNDCGVVTKFRKCISLFPMRCKNHYHKSISRKFYKILRISIKEDLKQGFEPDLIHSHVGPWCSYFCIPAAKKLGLPIITTEHYSGLTFGSSNDLKFVREKYVIENSDLTIFVGSKLQKNVLEITGAEGNTAVIPNQVSLDIFNNAVLDKYHRGFRFITACRLIPLKKVELVIRAFHEEFLNEKAVNFVIAGDGPMRKKLEELVNDLKENDRIHFIGEYKREEAPIIFSNCDAFVLTSEFETFGIVYIEAMMCGLPCIGTKGQGSDDIINNNNGISVEFGNINELRKAMRTIYQNISLYNRKDIRHEVINKFSEDVICKQLENVYKKLINKN